MLVSPAKLLPKLIQRRSAQCFPQVAILTSSPPNSPELVLDGSSQLIQRSLGECVLKLVPRSHGFTHCLHQSLQTRLQVAAAAGRLAGGRLRDIAAAVNGKRGHAAAVNPRIAAGCRLRDIAACEPRLPAASKHGIECTVSHRKRAMKRDSRKTTYVTE